MPTATESRLAHHLLLTLACVLLFFVNLGGSSLWDIDEGNNAEAAREMYESGNWTVPTFNLALRVDKPALLYWLQMIGYEHLGINELAARLPSALAAWLTVLLVYELGRSMFNSRAGLLAGFALAACPGFVAAAHFANPDALLTFSVTLIFAAFWSGYARTGRLPFALMGTATGLGMLAKGPVAIVLPTGVILLFLLLNRQLSRWLRPGLLLSILTFALVAAPWYTMVALETKGAFLIGFLRKHNVNRFLDTMESHHGPIYYYLLVLLAGFFPWSIFIGAVGWQGWRGARGPADSPAGQPLEDAARRRLGTRLLLCWAAVFVVFFSCSRTKLPNYVLPMYPALALLTADFLERWRRGELTLPVWMMRVSVASLLVAGLLMGAGLTLVSGIWTISFVRIQVIPELTAWLWIAAVPIVGSLVGFWCLHQQRRNALVATLVVGTLLILVPIGGWGGLAFNGHKTPKPIAAVIAAHARDPEIRVGTFECFDPSLVFYCQRAIQQLGTPDDLRNYVGRPLTTYVVLPATSWQRLADSLPGCHVISEHHDFYRNRAIVVVTNR